MLHPLLSQIETLGPKPGETLTLAQSQRLHDLGTSLDTDTERLAPHEPPARLASDAHTFIDALRRVSSDVDALVAAQLSGGDRSTSRAQPADDLRDATAAQDRLRHDLGLSAGT